MLGGIITSVIANAITLFAVFYVISAVDYSKTWQFFLLAGFLIGLANITVKPVMKLLSLPFIILTAGLFLIIINAAVLWILSKILTGIDNPNIYLSFPDAGTLFASAFLFGIINWIVNKII